MTDVDFLGHLLRTCGTSSPIPLPRRPFRRLGKWHANSGAVDERAQRTFLTFTKCQLAHPFLDGRVLENLLVELGSPSNSHKIANLHRIAVGHLDLIRDLQPALLLRTFKDRVHKAVPARRELPCPRRGTSACGRNAVFLTAGSSCLITTSRSGADSVEARDEFLALTDLRLPRIPQAPVWCTRGGLESSSAGSSFPCPVPSEMDLEAGAKFLLLCPESCSALSSSCNSTLGCGFSKYPRLGSL